MDSGRLLGRVGLSFGHDPGSGYRFLDPHPALHEPLECLGPSDQIRCPKGSESEIETREIQLPG